MIRKYIDNKKLTASILLALILCPFMNMAKAKSEIDSSLSDSTVVEMETAIYTTPNDISLYQLALQSDMTVEALRKLNHGSIDEIDTLEAGQSILLPQHASFFNGNTQTSESVSAISALPQLGGTNNEELLASSLLNKTSVGRNVTGTAEENAANIAKTVATQNWDELSAEQIKQDAEEWAKNQAKQAVMAPVQKGANDLLGKFGKASVNISIDENGSLKGSTLSLLSPWYDNKESLIFSQVGEHRQNGDRTIGNFGLGYRYEQDSYLVGGNVFIDHDFSGNNTRLGLGTELWMDYIKLAANYYAPLSDWKDSNVILDFEERPAEGFDIHAQGYLPSYPQLGTSVKYEQYFGDQVGLFGDNKASLQKNPKAVSVGIDYTPVPLLTLQATQRFGDDGQTDTRVDMNLNVQLGTSLEKQLDPANVAASRSLKGSRYDLVDRNYDIVFEYRQKVFQVMWNLPVPYTMSLGGSLPLQAQTTSQTPIVKVVWSIKNGLGTEVVEGIDPQDLIDNDLILNFKPNDVGTYLIVATITNEAGMTVTSSQFELKVQGGVPQNANLVLFQTEISASSVESLPSDWAGEYTDNQKLMMTVKAVQTEADGTNESPFKLPNGIWWIQVSKDGVTYIDTLNPDIQFGKPETISLVLSDVMADPDNGRQYGLVSAINFGRSPVTVRIGYGVVGAESIKELELVHEVYFHNFLPEDLELQLVERGIDGRGVDKIMTMGDHFVTDTYYELRVIDLGLQKDVTAEFVEGIRWHYQDENDTLINLEACIGYTMFSTQRTNFMNNEFSWGQLIAHPEETEQGLRLRPSIDPSNWNPQGQLNTTTGSERGLVGSEATGNVYCPDSGAAVEAESTYNGFNHPSTRG